MGHRAIWGTALALFMTPIGIFAQEAAAPIEDQAALIADAKKKLERDLKDPSSVQYRDVYVVKPGTAPYVCGEYNAKNSYGAYVGFKPFFSSGDKVMADSDNAVIGVHFVRLWQNICGAKKGA